MTSTEALSDQNILEKSFKDPRYFSILVDRYQSAFMRKSLSILHSKEAAEDAVQEAFLKIYKNARSWRPKKGASFKSWAYIILRNTCFDHYRNQKKDAEHVVSVGFSEDILQYAPENEGEETYKSFDVESILSLMPTKLARILRLYFLEERSQKEIAKIENISYGAVRTRIHRAKNYFRKLSTNPS